MSEHLVLMLLLLLVLMIDNSIFENSARICPLSIDELKKGSPTFAFAETIRKQRPK
jgi:hypothetical protein